jgi:ubiquinone/menaquinone biosynthesis C-methylase UbiE
MIDGKQQTEVTAYFSRGPDAYAGEYGRETANGYSFRVRRERLLELLGAGSGKLLDIGCGPGVMTAEIVGLGWDYVGLDISEAMVAEARRRFPEGERVKFGTASVEHLLAADSAFDAVVAMGLVEYLDDDLAAVKELARVVKPGGRVFVSIPNRWSPVRCWDRWVLGPLIRVRRFLRRRTAASGVRHREHSVSSYGQILEAAGLAPTAVVAYNFRVLPRPADAILPSLAVRTAKLFEPLRKTPFSFLGTGYIIEAVKRS